ncbi:ubiquinol oxidase subunit II [Alkanindiges illinoisensis]|uniref:Ubiquinol oxidase subunit 2 n=1 Tax=Alkanindiges illinoisensis TaxID=197183 RepID=A0A4Y7XFV0_9GAMM|nr:ubiquinol oxidase subunit II [Alkanindiges illinoisensis]TEU30721.1 ubiquinol oxidase subunit II [Alkanindiges illinoisensis]
MRQTFLAVLSLCAIAVLLTGCSGDIVIFNSKGQIGIEQRDLIIISFVLMLLVVIPAIFMTFYFGWKYRQGNGSAEYLPKWAHSTKIEIVVWGVPILIICALAYLAGTRSFSLDPYKPITAEKVAQSVQNNPDQAIANQAKKQPVTIQVIAEQWKWVFIYPEQNIATVNEIVLPVNTPINFRITSNSVMNSFFIPQLGGQVYAMAGMQTQLHLIADELSDRDGKPGIGPDDGYRGISANYSGYGFSNMRFRAHSVTDAEFNAWVNQVKTSPQTLDMAKLRALRDDPKNRQPHPHPVEHFSSVEPNLFKIVIDQYMAAQHSHTASKANHANGHAAGEGSHTAVVEE